MVAHRVLASVVCVRVVLGVLMNDKIKKLYARMDALIVEATNIHNLAYIYDVEDEQEWIDYQDKLNYLSVDRKKY